MGKLLIRIPELISDRFLKVDAGAIRDLRINQFPQ